MRLRSARNLRLAVLHRDDGYGRGVRDVTSSIIASDSLPIDVVANVSYATTATTFQPQLISVKEANQMQSTLQGSPQTQPKQLRKE